MDFFIFHKNLGFVLVVSPNSIGNEDLNPELEAYLDFFVEIASIGP